VRLAGSLPRLPPSSDIVASAAFDGKLPPRIMAMRMAFRQSKAWDCAQIADDSKTQSQMSVVGL
jgi:hypothetical protein